MPVSKLKRDKREIVTASLFENLKEAADQRVFLSGGPS